jgi:hypothetical protein
VEIAVERGENCWVVPCGVGLADAPADRAEVAHARSRDLLGRRREHRQRVGERGRGLDGAVAGQRADLDPLFGNVDVIELLDPVDVDDVLRRGEPVRHHDPERLVARHQLGVVFVLREEVGRLRHRRWLVVLERGRFHPASPPADDRSVSSRLFVWLIRTRSLHSPTASISVVVILSDRAVSQIQFGSQSAV